MEPMDLRDLPMGFSMALSRNAEAMQSFSAMSATERQAVLAQTHKVQSKQEMRALVQQLSQKN